MDVDLYVFRCTGYIASISVDSKIYNIKIYMCIHVQHSHQLFPVSLVSDVIGGPGQASVYLYFPQIILHVTTRFNSLYQH